MTSDNYEKESLQEKNRRLEQEKEELELRGLAFAYVYFAIKPYLSQGERKELDDLLANRKDVQENSSRIQEIISNLILRKSQYTAEPEEQETLVSDVQAQSQEHAVEVSASDCLCSEYEEILSETRVLFEDFFPGLNDVDSSEFLDKAFEMVYDTQLKVSELQQELDELKSAPARIPVTVYKNGDASEQIKEHEEKISELEQKLEKVKSFFKQVIRDEIKDTEDSKIFGKSFEIIEYMLEQYRKQEKQEKEDEEIRLKNKDKIKEYEEKIEDLEKEVEQKRKNVIKQQEIYTKLREDFKKKYKSIKDKLSTRDKQIKEIAKSTDKISKKVLLLSGFSKFLLGNKSEEYLALVEKDAKEGTSESYPFMVNFLQKQHIPKDTLANYYGEIAKMLGAEKYTEYKETEFPDSISRHNWLVNELQVIVKHLNLMSRLREWEDVVKINDHKRVVLDHYAFFSNVLGHKKFKEYKKTRFKTDEQRIEWLSEAFKQAYLSRIKDEYVSMSTYDDARNKIADLEQKLESRDEHYQKRKDEYTSSITKKKQTIERQNEQIENLKSELKKYKNNDD